MKLGKIVTSTFAIALLLAIVSVGLINLPIFARKVSEMPPPETSKNVLASSDTILSFFKPKYNASMFLVRDQVNARIENKIENAAILKFYSSFTGDWTIASVITKYALKYDIPINLAFALAYGESRFDPKARNVNYNEDGSVASIDRGLYQLNDKSRNWPIADYYNIEKNTNEGLAYLSYCLYIMKDDVVKALQAYNAGPNKVWANKVPKRTIRHVKEILQYENMLNQEFNEAFVGRV